MRELLCSFGLSALFAVAPVPAHTQIQPQSNSAAQSPGSGVASTSGVRDEILTELKYEEDRFVRLAQAVPAEKYTWRPADGVRSVSEVFMHVAAANYNIPRLLGTPPPTDFKVQGFDKSTTEKAKVIDTLRDSFSHAEQAVANVADADLEKQLDWINGKKNTERGVMIFLVRHAAEHLGQLIAYARENGIVPPWSEEQQKKAQEKPKQ